MTSDALITKFNTDAATLVATANHPSLKSLTAERRDTGVFVLVNSMVFGRGVDLQTALKMARTTAKKYDDMALRSLFGR